MPADHHKTREESLPLPITLVHGRATRNVLSDAPSNIVRLRLLGEYTDEIVTHVLGMSVSDIESAKRRWQGAVIFPLRLRWLWHAGRIRSWKTCNDQSQVFLDQESINQ